MLDGLYSRLIARVDYRLLIFVPPAIALLFVAVIAVNGLPLGIDFQGGTWIDLSLDERLSDAQTDALVASLEELGLDEVSAQWGFDASAGQHKLTIVTATETGIEAVAPVLEPAVGSLTEYDRAIITGTGNISAEDLDRLRSRFPAAEITYQEDTLIIAALDLDAEELQRAVQGYFGNDADIALTPRNFNLRSVGPTLGSRFRSQGLKAFLVAYLFMTIVVAVAFREFIPTVAVLAAATCDILIAAGGMSLFGIQMEPASLAALLMLIGYSVDSDILLTARVLKRRGFEVNERIDEAMTTGLTMTGTTLAALLIIQIVSTWVLPIQTFKDISSVLLLGLAADLISTWFMNAGILKWYLERPSARKRRWQM